MSLTWKYPGANVVSDAARKTEGCVLTTDLRAAIGTCEALLTVLPDGDASDSQASFVRSLRDDLVRWVNALNDPYWEE